jgi:hypothetical protein
MFDFDKNKLLTAFAAVALLACTCMMNNKGVVEGFGPTKVVVAQPAYAKNAASAMKGQIFAAPPNFQAMLTPRCGISVGLPASITYNMPNSKNMAYRTDSAFAAANTNCGAGNISSLPINQTINNNASLSSSTMPPVRENFQAGNNGPMNNQQPSMLNMSGIEMPAKAMAGADGLPNLNNAVVFNRYMAANPDSRIRGLGCPIRGDLPVIPCSTGWFQVSARPSRTLQQGAMNVLGGVTNSTTNEMNTLINMNSGGAITTLSGVNMSNEMGQCLSGAGQTVQATAFP